MNGSLMKQPRTAEGNFWHKQIYPNQVWLDGFYMALPFYAEYTRRFAPKEQKTAMYDDIVCMPVFPNQEKNQNVFMKQMKQMSKGILLERIVEINILEKQETGLEEKVAKRYWVEAMQAVEKGGKLLEGIRATKAENL